MTLSDILRRRQCCSIQLCQLAQHQDSKDLRQMSPQTTTEGRQKLPTLTRHIPLLLTFLFVITSAFHSRTRKLRAALIHFSTSRSRNRLNRQKDRSVTIVHLQILGCVWDRLCMGFFFSHCLFWVWRRKRRLLVIREKDLLYTYAVLTS
jgi:hypothetical protein